MDDSGTDFVGAVKVVMALIGIISAFITAGPLIGFLFFFIPQLAIAQSILWCGHFNLATTILKALRAF